MLSSYKNVNIEDQGSDIAYLLIYVDDLILTASSATLLQRMITSLYSEFSMTDLGPLHYFLRISVSRDAKCMSLCQRKYSLEILERASMLKCQSYHTPVDIESKLDVDWVGCPITRRSTFGYCVFLGNNLLLWSSKRQATLSRSSAQAEYHGVANVVIETTWLRNLLQELHSLLQCATLVYCDNISAMYMSSNPVKHQRMKHVEVDIHFVCDQVSAGHVCVSHVPSRY
ncbi:ribonuclease H-like domain-containing protein [Tanacetum coccineum]